MFSLTLQISIHQESVVIDSERPRNPMLDSCIAKETSYFALFSHYCYVKNFIWGQWIELYFSCVCTLIKNRWCFINFVEHRCEDFLGRLWSFICLFFAAFKFCRLPLSFFFISLLLRSYLFLREILSERGNLKNYE